MGVASPAAKMSDVASTLGGASAADGSGLRRRATATGATAPRRPTGADRVEGTRLKRAGIVARALFSLSSGAGCVIRRSV